MKEISQKTPIVISLVGMSGSGKSRWSKKLAEKGFRRICCDDLIEKDLAVEMKENGVEGIHGVARWMGHPYEEQFKRNQEMYLNSEIRNMRKIIDQLKRGVSENTVIDTTGSVIYTGSEIMKALQKNSLVVYLETPMSALSEMLRVFMEHPKPVIWRKMFSQKKGEETQEALRRCYPRLLKERMVLYKKYSDVMLSYKTKKRPGFNVDSFIRFVEKAGKKKELS